MPVLDNAQHERFCQLKVEGNTDIDAYTGAGYKHNYGNASALARDPKIQARVRELLEAAAAKTVVNKAWVTERLVENVERAMTATPVLDREGNQTGEWRYDGAVANKALELLGKDIGMFVERTENKNLNKNYVINGEPLSDDEWAAKHVTKD